jgi:peptide/nickel transport system substrate-binding protein
MSKKRTMGISVATAATGLALLAGALAPATQASTSAPVRVVAVETGDFNTRNFNPYSAGVLSDTQGMEYQSLFFFNTTANSTVIPLLGTSYAWSNGGKTLTVQLRKGVKWSDGQAFTAKDVLFTYNLLKKYPAMDGEAVMKHVSTVTAPNDYEVQFHFAKVYSTYDYYTLGVYIVPAHIWANVKGDPSKWTDPNPIGTGAFVLSSFSPQAFFYKPNPTYWGGKPKVASVEYPAYSGNDSADLALVDGLVDYAGLFVPNIQKVWAQKNNTNSHYWYPAGSPTVLYPNMNNPVLGNKAVREAMNIALDRTPEINQAEYGYPHATNPLALMPSQTSWADPSLGSSALNFTVNTAKAEQILQAAGFKKNSAGVYQDAKGNKLAFDLDVVAGWTDWDESCSLIAQQLNAIGFQVTVQQQQWGDYSNELYGKPTNKPYVVMSWTNAGPNPYFEYQASLHTGSVGGDNFEHYKNPAVDAALDNFSTTTSSAQQKKDIYTVEKAMINDVPFIPMWDGPTWYEYSTKNYVGWPTASNPYVDPAPWTAQAEAIVLSNLKPAH